MRISRKLLIKKERLGMKEKAEYVMICDCGTPKPIPNYILQAYIASGVDRIYCDRCQAVMEVPEYLIKIAGDL